MCHVAVMATVAALRVYMGVNNIVGIFLARVSITVLKTCYYAVITGSQKQIILPFRVLFSLKDIYNIVVMPSQCHLSTHCEIVESAELLETSCSLFRLD